MSRLEGKQSYEKAIGIKIFIWNSRQVFDLGVVFNAVRVSAELDEVVLPRSASDVVSEILLSLLLR